MWLLRRLGSRRTSRDTTEPFVSVPCTHRAAHGPDKPGSGGNAKVALAAPLKLPQMREKVNPGTTTAKKCNLSS